MRADINLLPKKESSISTKNVAIISIISIVVLTLVGYFFVFLPNTEKKAIAREIEKKEEELTQYEGLDEEFIILQTEIKDLKDMLDAVDGITSNYVKITDKLEEIEDAIPVDIVLSSFSYGQELISISGKTPDYKKVAQFMVNLRKMEDVQSVNLHSIIHEEIEKKGVKTIRYIFTIDVNYGVWDEEVLEEMENEDIDVANNEAVEEEGDE